MLIVSFKPSFLRKMGRLDTDFKEEVFEKVNLLKDNRNHRILKVHKLHGKFSDYFSFSVNYKTRIVFEYVSKNEVALLTIGDHTIYD